MKKRSRVLLLEDEALLALDLQMLLEDNDYEVMGPLQGAPETLELLGRETPSAAILDVNLGGGETSFPVAKKLREDAVPFLFLTGYARSTMGIPEDFREVPRLDKPLKPAQLLKTLSQILNGE